jgi:hypothetical protein
MALFDDMGPMAYRYGHEANRQEDQAAFSAMLR